MRVAAPVIVVNLVEAIIMRTVSVVVACAGVVARFPFRQTNKVVQEATLDTMRVVQFSGKFASLVYFALDVSDENRADDQKSNFSELLHYDASSPFLEELLQNTVRKSFFIRPKTLISDIASEFILHFLYMLLTITQ